MKHLTAITSLPFATPDRRIICRPGFDEATGIYLHLQPDYVSRIPDTPSASDVRRAVARMMRPWRHYRFDGPDSAAGLVSGVLASVCRPSLSLCPAYMIDASQQASGKTKCAASLGAIIEGEHPAVTPYSGSSQDEEMRKRLVAGVIEQAGFHCIDNVTGFMKSSVLAAVLTSGKLNDRVLGQSRNITARVNALMTMTGNNASMDADLTRRTVRVRIDAGDNPAHRSFDSCPVSEALADRLAIAEAACTIWRAYLNARAPDIIKGDVGGFTDWNRLCRQPVLWLAREGLADDLPWKLGDPAASMLADPADTDPEIEALGDLLRALWELTEGRDFTAAEALEYYATGEHQRHGLFHDLRSAVLECTGRADLSAKGMGRVLQHRRDRTVGGYKLLARGAGGAAFKLWRVVSVEATTGLMV